MLKVTDVLELYNKLYL